MFTTITAESLVTKDHAYRKVEEVLDIRPMVRAFRGLYSKLGTPGIPIEKGFKALLIQFMEDYSDRQMECALRENIAVKWFCGYELRDETPDHTYFCKLRKRLGTENVAKVFNLLVFQLKAKRLSGNGFHFIDASAVIPKTALWRERDKAIHEGESNSIISTQKITVQIKMQDLDVRGRRSFGLGTSDIFVRTCKVGSSRR